MTFLWGSVSFVLSLSIAPFCSNGLGFRSPIRNYNCHMACDYYPSNGPTGPTVSCIATFLLLPLAHSLSFTVNYPQCRMGHLSDSKMRAPSEDTWNQSGETSVARCARPGMPASCLASLSNLLSRCLPMERTLGADNLRLYTRRTAIRSSICSSNTATRASWPKSLGLTFARQIYDCRHVLINFLNFFELFKAISEISILVVAYEFGCPSNVCSIAPYERIHAHLLSIS